MSFSPLTIVEETTTRYHVDWIDFFQWKRFYKTGYLEASISCMGLDHWPVQLEINLKETPPNRPFRFESFWLQDAAFLDLLEKWW